MHISELKKGENQVEISYLDNWTYRDLSHEELICQYQETLELVKEQRKEIKEEITELKKILKENKLPGQSIRLTKKRKAAIKARWQELESQDAPYSLIQGNLEYSLSWMKCGHSPGFSRGIERRSVYQNTKLVDPIKMQQFYRSTYTGFEWDEEPKENVITRSERIVLDKAMDALTKKELETYLMKAKGLSQYQIADILGVSRNAVKSRLAKANKKIAIILQEMEDDM